MERVVRTPVVSRMTKKGLERDGGLFDRLMILIDREAESLLEIVFQLVNNSEPLFSRQIFEALRKFLGKIEVLPNIGLDAPWLREFFDCLVENKFRALEDD